MSVDIARVQRAQAQLRAARQALDLADSELSAALASAPIEVLAPPAVARPVPPPPAQSSATSGLQNPAAFFDCLRGKLWPTIPESIFKQLQALLTAGAGRLPLSWMAYALATTYHETGATMAPIRERGSGDKDRDGVDDWFEKYGRGRLATQLGNRSEADGGLFHGRGYVQLTGRRNYTVATAKLLAIGVLKPGESLVDTPDLAMRPDVAAAVLVLGMVEGWFTGVKCRDFIGTNATAKQYVNARRIINGTDCAQKIAGYALQFEQALKAGVWL